MTLLTVVNEVCDVVLLDRFDSVYGTNDPNAQTMVALAEEAGGEIARRADWRRMLKTLAISGSPELLPSDYQRLAPGGAVRMADGRCFRPVTNEAQWAAVVAVGSAEPYFHLRGKAMLLSPAVSAAGATADYYSKNWVLGDPHEERGVFRADDDATFFPERLLVKGLIWRWKRQKGLPFEDNLAEFEADLLQEINADRGI